MSRLDLAPYQELIKQRCGLLLEGNNLDKLATALSQRIAVTGCADYYAKLYADHGEFQELVNLLTINETYFFREPEQLELLTGTLVPRLLAERHGQLPLRILSAGCSSGEEPYSILMALREQYGESADALFAVSGGDIDTQVLAKARSGCYGEFSFRGVPAAIKTRYFERLPYAYRIREDVRRRVEFHQLNLLAASYPAAPGSFDVIFLRNVSIYFDTPTRRLIQRNLATLLKDDGCLVIGTAETLANDLGELALVEENGLFYFVKHGSRPTLTVPPRPTMPPADRPLAAPPAMVAAWLPADLPVSAPAAVSPPIIPPAREAAPQPAAAAARDLAQARQLVEEKRFDAALVLLEEVLAATPADTAALLLKAHVQLHRKSFSEAQETAQKALAVAPWSVDALMVLGLAAKWREQPSEAVRWFKQAVYTRHECWPARYYLAELYRNGGETEKARREYRGVQQTLSRQQDAGLKVVPLALPAAEIRFLCEHQLAKLDQAQAALGK